MRILLTNDDGIDSIGLHVLARAMREHGDVVIIAPDREFSGAGAALGALHLMVPDVCKHYIDGIDEAWSVSGPPALCVMFARLGAFGAPFDLIVSGINPGANVGRSVYHSGTVGACLSGRNGGIPGVAVSQAVTGFGIEGQGWDEMLVGQKWHTAAAVASSFVGGMAEAIAAGSLEDAAVVNINVPNCELDEIAGWKHARVGVEPPRRMSNAELVPKEGHEGAFTVKMAWGDAVELPSDTDGSLVESGWVSLSYLTRLQESSRDDLGAAEAGLTSLLG
jgi:5'-nucleotidase